MNKEKIKEIGNMAEKLADEATNACNDTTGEWMYSWNDVYDQKFAELIIKECLEQINSMQVDKSDQLYPMNDIVTDFVNDRIIDIHSNIVEYFGVKL